METLIPYVPNSLSSGLRMSNQSTVITPARPAYDAFGVRRSDGGYHAAVAWTAGAIALGAVVASVPTTCESVVVNGVTYRQCQNGWFEPRYQGHNVVYVVVPAPR